MTLEKALTIKSFVCYAVLAATIIACGLATFGTSLWIKWPWFILYVLSAAMTTRNALIKFRDDYYVAKTLAECNCAECKKWR